MATKGLTEVLYLRGTPEQHKLLLKKAAMANQRVSTWARIRLRNHLGVPDQPETHQGGSRSTGESPVIFIRVEPALHDACLRASLEGHETVNNWCLKFLLRTNHR
jgi:predicted HicB family RNase H-like nuclease